jgi:hypothetical protein
MTAPGVPQPIDAAIDSYASRAGEGGSGAAPYNSESLAEIYAPRVRQLFDLKKQGFTHAVWKWDQDAGHNRWHGANLQNLNPQQFGGEGSVN